MKLVGGEGTEGEGGFNCVGEFGANTATVVQQIPVNNSDNPTHHNDSFSNNGSAGQLC